MLAHWPSTTDGFAYHEDRAAARSEQEGSYVVLLNRGHPGLAAALSWLALSLPEADRTRRQHLSARSKEDALSADEAALLENYLHVGRLFDLMRSKARLSLAQAGT